MNGSISYIIFDIIEVHELEQSSLLIHSALAFGREFQVAMAVRHRFMKF